MIIRKKKQKTILKAINSLRILYQKSSRKRHSKNDMYEGIGLIQIIMGGPWPHMSWGGGTQP